MVLFWWRNPKGSFIFLVECGEGGATSFSKRKFSWGGKKKLIFTIVLYLPTYTHSGKVWKSWFHVRTQAKGKKKFRFCHHCHAGVEILWPSSSAHWETCCCSFRCSETRYCFFVSWPKEETVEKEQILYLDPNTKVEQIHSNHSPHWDNIWHKVGLTLGAHMGEWQNLPSDLEHYLSRSTLFPWCIKRCCPDVWFPGTRIPSLRNYEQLK